MSAFPPAAQGKSRARCRCPAPPRLLSRAGRRAKDTSRGRGPPPPAALQLDNLFLKLGHGRTDRSLRYPGSSPLLRVFQNKDEESDERRAQTIKHRWPVYSVKPTPPHKY